MAGPSGERSEAEELAQVGLTEKDAGDLDRILAPLSRTEIILLVRFVASKTVLEVLQPYFWGKYGLILIGLVIGGGLKWGGQVGWDGAAFIFVLFLFLAFLHHLAERLVTRMIRRLGAHHRLEGLEEIYDEMFDWRTQLKKGLKRAGSPWKMLKAAVRDDLDLDGDEAAYFKDGELVVDWRTSLGLDRLAEARAILARSAARSPTS